MTREEKEKWKLVNYLYNHGYKVWNAPGIIEPSDEHDQNNLHNIYVNEISGVAFDLNQTQDTYYYAINIDNLTFEKYYYNTNTQSSTFVLYNYLTDIGESTLNFKLSNGDVIIRSMYNFSSGTGECKQQGDYFANKECSITDFYNLELRNIKKEFINIVHESNIDINIIQDIK